MKRLKLAAKKLQPAKRAWKSFSKTIQYKVHKLNIPKAIKATRKRLLLAFHSICHVINSRFHHSITTTRPYATSYYQVQHKNVKAIHIDDLFENKASSMAMHATNKGSAHNSRVATSKGKEKEVNGNYYKENLVGESSGLNTIEDAWKVVVAKSPQLQVDQKAEEFISRFREDMRLQKERSMLEFQERLARSA